MAHIINAQGKTLGRIASEAAHHLLGKHTASFVRNRVVGEEVKIENASKVRLSGTKESTKKYVRYSGYPSGIKIESYAMLTSRRGHKEAVKRAVYRMLPKNRLRGARMKLLTITD